MRWQVGNGNARADTAGEAVAALLIVMVIRRAGASVVLRAWLPGRSRMHGKAYRRPAKKGERAKKHQETPDKLAHAAQRKEGQ